MKIRVLGVGIAACLLVAACGKEADETIDTTETGGVAVGEVLGGTISDEMLPLDELTSTSPPAQGASEAGVESDPTAAVASSSEADEGSQSAPESLPVAPALPESDATG